MTMPASPTGSRRRAPRNRLPAVVEAVGDGPLSVAVALRLAGDDRLTAMLSRPSAEALDLAPGLAVQAWLLEPGIVLLDGRADAPTSAASWPAQVVGIRRGGLNLDASLRLPGGSHIHVVVTEAAGRELGLARGRRLRVAVLPSQVLLAVGG